MRALGPRDVFEDRHSKFYNLLTLWQQAKIVAIFLFNESDFFRQKHILEQKSHPIPTQAVSKIGLQHFLGRGYVRIDRPVI
jgi:hypothetical protein